MRFKMGNPISRPQRIWSYQENTPIPVGISSNFQLDEIILQYLVNQGFTDPLKAACYLDHNKYTPSPAYDLPDMQKGISRIAHAIKTGELIGVWGDFDVDGQTATAVLVSALRKLNAPVTYYIPIRKTDSHGMALEPFKRFLERGVKVVLTCDTGISAHESIIYAQSRGIDVVVTDHHQLPSIFPPAHALINPQRIDAAHPLHVLAGVGTAYKFAEALLSLYGQEDFSRQLHDLVALGTLADVALLTGENRYLVQSGLANLTNSPRPSIRDLFLSAEIDSSFVSEEQVSFSIAPRLNAVGRLSDANPMVEFLLSEDPVFIKTQLNLLEGLNTQRKLLCDQVFNGAVAQIDRQPNLLDHPVLIVHHPEWPAGVIGIIASRLVDLYYRPVLLLTGKPGEPLRGSARSIAGIDITEALRQNSQHLLSYGGHPFAAGLSLSEDVLNTFQRGLDASVTRMVGENILAQELRIDARIYSVDFSLARVKGLNVLSPFGPGNPPLAFVAEGMRLVGSAPVGRLGEHLLVDVVDPEGNQTRLTWWNGARNLLPEGLFNLAYSVRPANYRGEEQVAFEWIDYQVSKDEIDIQPKPYKKQNTNLDFRSSQNPLHDFKNFPFDESLACWKEGSDKYPVSGANRFELQPSSDLVIWTTPPDLKAITNIFNTVHPTRVAWFLIDPEEQKPANFLRTLGKLLKKGLVKGDSTFLFADLAAATATTCELAELGVNWHIYSGNLQVTGKSTEGISLSRGGKIDNNSLSITEKAITNALREIQAFSNYLKRADLDELVRSIG
jgi:single-stranded-DNA-specific exonuclease